MHTPPITSVSPLVPGHIHVWQISLEADPTTLTAHRILLSDDERQRADRFALPDLRRRFTVARANLRQLLATYIFQDPRDLQFIYGTTGKPELLDQPCHFNLSHTDDLALIAIAPCGPDNAVGIDLEKIRPLDYQAVARPVLSELDQRALAQATPSAQADLFFQLWVRHEARAKATGAGIATHSTLPVYDLDVGPSYRAAVATAMKDVQIHLLNR